MNWPISSMAQAASGRTQSRDSWMKRRSVDLISICEWDRRMESHASSMHELPPRNDFWKWLPVLYMWGTILFLYLTYVFQHCIPRMQLDVETDLVNMEVRSRGYWEMTTVNCLTAMLFICYARAMCTSPGTIPSRGSWEYQAEDILSYLPSFPSFIKEKKRSGDRRYCKWCSKYKPDRTHHCRTCKRCILKMDHHCPWMYNCVGFFNYKYFYLLLLYSLMTVLFIVITMSETVRRVIEIPTPFLARCVIFVAETVGILMASLVSLGFGYHTYLLTNAMSNIEFWEQNDPKPDAEYKATPGLYDLGVYSNIKASLGDQMLLWLLPVNPPTGDGIHYPSSEGGQLQIAYEDMEATKTMVRKEKAKMRPERDICGRDDQGYKVERKEDSICWVISLGYASDRYLATPQLEKKAGRAELQIHWPMMQHINLEFSCLYRAQGEKVVVSLVKGNLSQMHFFQFGEYLANSGRSFPVHQIPVEKVTGPKTNGWNLRITTLKKENYLSSTSITLLFSRLSFGWGGGVQISVHLILTWGPMLDILMRKAWVFRHNLDKDKSDCRAAFFLPCGSQ